MKCPQHIRVGEESIALLAKDWPMDFARHIAAVGNLSRANVDLPAMPVCVFNGCAVHDSI